MLIRIKNRNKGVVDYLINGKVNQGIHRNEYDKREIVSGDLAQLNSALKYTEHHRDWKSSHKHFTVSFSLNDHEKLMRLPERERALRTAEIVKDVLAAHYPHRDPDELIQHAELHVPKPEHFFDEKGDIRKVHIHCIVSNLDPKTGNRLKAIDFNIDHMAAIQSSLAVKHGFDDPANYLREEPEKRAVPTTISEFRNELTSYIAEHKPKSGKELNDLLLKNPLVSSVKSTSTKKNRYVSVFLNKLNKNGKPHRLNLRGGVFDELLQPLYNQYQSNDSKKDKELQEAFKSSFLKDESKVNVFNRVKTNKDDEHPSREEIANDPKLRAKIIKESQEYFFNKNPNKETTPAAKKWKRENDHYIKELDQNISDLSMNQRNFFMCYRDNIQKEIIKDAKIFTPPENKEIKIITSKDLSAKIVDHGEKLTLSSNKNTNIQDSAKLMIQTCISKGWGLDEIKSNGSDEFKEAISAEIEILRKAEQTKAIELKEDTAINPQKTPAITSHASQFEQSSRIKTNAQNKQFNDDVNTIKQNINVDTVIALAKAHGFDKKYSVTTNTKGHLIIQAEGGKKLNAYDYIIKNCDIKASEAFNLVNQAYRSQESNKPPEPAFAANTQLNTSNELMAVQTSDIAAAIVNQYHNNNSNKYVVGKLDQGQIDEVVNKVTLELGEEKRAYVAETVRRLNNKKDADRSTYISNCSNEAKRKYGLQNK